VRTRSLGSGGVVWGKEGSLEGDVDSPFPSMATTTITW
jgi:hypothetical protein